MEPRVPGLPSRDFSVISKLLGGEDGKGDREIFVQCPTGFKGKLLGNILKAEDRIPTLGTLFEDLNYLGPLSSSMKLLIDPPAKQTSIHTLSRKSFTETNRNSAAVIGLSGCFACKTFLSWCHRHHRRSKSVRGQLNKRTLGELA